MPNGVGLINPRKAAARALANYLKTLSTIDSGKAAGPYGFANSFEDWPELDKQLKYPSVSCTPIAGEYEATDLGLVYLYSDPIYKLATWPTSFGLPALSNTQQGYLLVKCGEYKFPLQLDVWADSVPELDAATRAIEDAMDGALTQLGANLPAPGGSYFGLRLNAGTSYFNRTCEYGLRRDAANTNADQALRDERRRTLIVDASIEWVKVAVLVNMQPNLLLNVTEKPLPNPPAPGSFQAPSPN